MKNSKWTMPLLLFLLLNFPEEKSIAQWFQLPSGITTNLNSIYFVNYNTGWAAGDSGKIIITINGGNNWSQQQSSTTYTLRSVQFVDAGNGWTVGGIYYLQYNLNIIKHTTNGGADWATVAGLGDAYSLYQSVYFVNSMTGFVTAAGTTGFYSRGYVSKTTNGGFNWINVTPNMGFAYYSVRFSDAQNGFITAKQWNDLGIDTAYVLKTTNGGGNWTSILAVGSSNFNSIFFPAANNGFLSGRSNNGGIVYKSTDGGMSWSLVQIVGTVWLTSIFFPSSGTGWTAGWVGQILRTTNGGNNWEFQNTGVSMNVNSLHFADINTGWAACGGGIILKTTNGGVSGLEPLTNEVPQSFRLYQNYPNPFNPLTKIKFDIPSVETRLIASLLIYDILGREIATLVNEQLKPGTYEVEWDATNYPSGVYFYKLQAGDYSESKKMILLK